MKKFTKILAALLSMLMVVALIACSDATDTPEDSSASAVVSDDTAAGDTAAESTKLEPVLPDTKYNREFKIASGYVTETKYTTNLIISDETTGDILNDAIFSRTVLMEERFGITMVVDDIPVATLKTAHGSGEHIYDIGTATLSEITTVLTNGLATDLNKVNSIDLSNPWWDQNANAKFAITDKLFYTFSDFFITGIDNTRACYFNKELATDLNLGNLYSIAKEGTWTFEKFRAMCVVALSDLDGNGVIDSNDRVGVAEKGTQFYEAVMSACDMEPVKQGSDSVAYYSGNVERDKFIDVYTQVLDWFTKDNTYLNIANATALEMFKNGNSLFILYTFSECPKLRSETSVEFGIMPIPKYNEDQANYQHTSPNGDALFICAGTEEEMEFAGVMCEAAAYFSSNYYSDDAVMPSYFNLCLATKNAPDLDSSENLQIIHDTISYTIKLYGTEYMQAIYDQLAASNYNIASKLTQLDKLHVKNITKKLESYGVELD